MYERMIKEHGILALQLFLVVVFLTLNTALNMYNKWLFVPVEKKGAGLTVPLFITMTHSAAGFITALTLSQFPQIYAPRPITGGIKSWMAILAISMFFSAGVGFNNSSLLHIPLSLAQMIKSTHPVLLAVCLYFLEDARYTKEKIIAILGIVVGVILTVVGSLGSASTIGIIFSFCSVVSGALNFSFLSLTLGPSFQLDGFDILYYTTVPVILIMSVPMILTSEPQTLSNFVNQNGMGTTLLYVIIGCVIAVTYNLTQFFFIKSLSALYLSITGTAKVALIVVLSVIFFGDHVTGVNMLGVLIALTAFAYNSYLTYKEKLEAIERKKRKEFEKETSPKVNGEEGESLLKSAKSERESSRSERSARSERDVASKPQ